MYSLTICLLLVGLVAANEGPVVVEHQHQHHQPSSHNQDPHAPVAHHVEGQAPVVQAQPVPVHVVDYPQQAPPAGMYMPSSLLPADSPVVSQKPGSVVVNNKDQYGVPEPAGIPANYKPFGSWGLYIGGNPPDGYYSNFYKSLDGVQGNQVAGGSQAQVGPQLPPTSSFYKQSGSSVAQLGPNQYPYVYSAGELNSAYPIVNQHPSSYMMPGFGQSGVEGVSHYAPEFYATKRVGSPAQQAREISKVGSSSSSSSSQSSSSSTKGKSQQQEQAKGYAYAPAFGQFSPVAPFFGPQQPQYHHQQQHSQVLPYSVPVGSQIVGSQPGADGAFSPYGVHAFTRYAVKPVYGAQSQYYPSGVEQSGSVQSYEPVYKQQQYQAQRGYSSVVQHHNNQQPFSYYQPSSFGYQAFPVGVPAVQHQFGSVPVAPVSSAPVPVAPVAAPAVEGQVVSAASQSAPLQPQQAPVSPLQVEASPNSPLESPVTQQQQQEVQQQQQVVEKQVDKSGVKQ